MNSYYMIVIYCLGILTLIFIFLPYVFEMLRKRKQENLLKHYYSHQLTEYDEIHDFLDY